MSAGEVCSNGPKREGVPRKTNREYDDGENWGKTDSI